ncbi:hypothetical protein V2J09_010911 [Rumex salicifolius]
MIFGDYIVTWQRELLFIIELDVNHSTYAWVRLSGLSMVLYKEHVLFGNVLLLVDLNTLTAARGMFARICVEIDIIQPLLGSFVVNGEKVFLEYEGQLIDKGSQTPKEKSTCPTDGGNETVGSIESLAAADCLIPNKRDIGSSVNLGRGVEIPRFSQPRI